MGSAGRTGRGRPFCSNGARTHHARRRTGSRAGPPTPSHGYRRPTTRSSAVVAQKWMGEISGGGSRETLEEIERTDAKHVNLRWSVEMTAAAKIPRDLTGGCSPGSTQSERPKRGDRANGPSFSTRRFASFLRASIVSRSCSGSIAPTSQPSEPISRTTLTSFTYFFVNQSLAADGFAEFWQAYPRRVARGAAEKAYNRIIRSREATEAELLAGAMRYAAQRDGEDARFTKHPATWLNGKCWMDEPPPNGGRPRSYLDSIAAGLALVPDDEVAS
jgi:hypothetical protein